MKQYVYHLVDTRTNKNVFTWASSKYRSRKEIVEKFREWRKVCGESSIKGKYLELFRSEQDTRKKK